MKKKTQKYKKMKRHRIGTNLKERNKKIRAFAKNERSSSQGIISETRIDSRTMFWDEKEGKLTKYNRQRSNSN